MSGGIYQTPGGDTCSITADSGGHDLSTDSDIRLERLLESVCQQVSGWRGRCERGPNAELLDSTCPVELVVMLRDDDLDC